MTTTYSTDSRFAAVRPTPEQVQQRGARIAAEHGATLVAVGPVKVARTRRGSTAFDVRYTLQAQR